MTLINPSTSNRRLYKNWLRIPDIKESTAQVYNLTSDRFWPNLAIVKNTRLSRYRWPAITNTHKNFLRFDRRKHKKKMISKNRKSLSRLLVCSSLFKMIPWYCIAHPYCARFLHLVCAHEHLCVQSVGDIPQTKLDSKINAPFLLNKYVDPHLLYFIISMTTISSITEKKISRNLWLLFSEMK